MDTDALRQRARQRRKALKWGQEYVARRAGVSIGTLQNFELGKSVPQPENLASILKVLNIDPNAIEPTNQGRAGDEVRADIAFEPEVELATAPPTWPIDVEVFLDMMGAYLVRFPEEKRLQLIHSLTRQIFAAHENGQ